MLARLAPTPSGYLHEGNLANFHLTREVAREAGAALALRIDDADASRYRREYVDNIFVVLTEQGFDWTIGPRDTEDFESNWSQRNRTAEYFARLVDLSHAGIPSYACTCSRTDMSGVPRGGCPGGCRDRRTPLVAGSSALRVHVPAGTDVMVGDREVRLDEALGDFVVWRRDGLPAYQWVSLLEDERLGTTHIVRGEDLIASSAAQAYLARALGIAHVADATYVHHPLVLDAQGRKLSKSTRASSHDREGARA